MKILGEFLFVFFLRQLKPIHQAAGTKRPPQWERRTGRTARVYWEWSRICAELKPSNWPCSRWRIQNSEWPVICFMDAPQQVGGGDCGMYILKYCEFLPSNVDLAKISHDAMPLYRLKLAVQLLQGYS
ncbi:unnamed protein product [Prunus armeniaca]|uniref:Ubiquitin-like protease family profile domain-containing protein n=1 Tax=Prunus armeniaca TaxID=36596 RepID=A0A6J5WDS0_PRUAR|nr:unnamed protein product [Prunus armeniaca]